MLLAQDKNANQHPVYGAWLQGDIWRFAVLKDSDYCVSRAYIASEADQLNKIVYMLQFLKTIILNKNK